MSVVDRSAKNLLVELFVEELPPKALKKLGEAFAQGVFDGLKAQGLTTGSSTLTAFASPRRLAAHVSDVLTVAADKAQSVKLMPSAVGLDAQGEPTSALLKKLASLGADASAVPALKRQTDGKAEALFFESVVPGATLAAGLQKALDEALAKLPIPKLMTYQPASGALPGWSNVQFVRPAHGLVALHGAEVVPVAALGLKAGRETHGHRFEAAIDPIVLQDADHYAQQLREQGAVIASFAERRDEIAHQLQHAAKAEGLAPIDDDALLDEVTALVERPNVLLGRFDAEFLGVPPECLILTMKANQKYFPLLDVSHDQAGKLTNRFLIVSNIRPSDPSRVIEGNERVVRPRLADAKFFFDKDRKKKLADRLCELKKVVYLNKLGDAGDMYSRMERVRAIAREIGRRLGGPALAENAFGAATLAKADLLTDMVGEFPELQGVMGRYYALNDGELEVVADAIEDQYRPRFAGDGLPRERVGEVLALADKLETLVGMFAIGQVPTGDKDPFALRRHALGVIRLLIERSLPLELDRLIDLACVELHRQKIGEVPEHTPPWSVARSLQTSLNPGASDSLLNPLNDFVFERLASLLRDHGYSAREVESVLSLRMQRLADVHLRLVAVRAFSVLPEAASLASANKRVGNILRPLGSLVEPKVDASRLHQTEEVDLFRHLQEVAPLAKAAFDRGDYTASLQALAGLKEPVDVFFDHVMVNVDDEKLRANRLGLLARLHAEMNRVADLSKLAS